MTTPTEDTRTPEELRAKAKDLRDLADKIAPPYGFSVRASLVAKAHRGNADILDRRADELEAAAG